MATAERLIAEKGDAIASLGPDATALEAAQLMNDRHIGSVLVVQNDRLVGIFTERDVMRRIVAAQRSPATVPLHEVMTTPVACAAPHTTLEELRAVMRERRIRHVPVAQNGRLLGMISIGDLNKAVQDTQVLTIQYLQQYMSVG